MLSGSEGPQAPCKIEGRPAPPFCCQAEIEPIKDKPLDIKFKLIKREDLDEIKANEDIIKIAFPELDFMPKELLYEKYFKPCNRRAIREIIDAKAAPATTQRAANPDETLTINIVIPNIPPSFFTTARYLLCGCARNFVVAETATFRQLVSTQYSTELQRVWSFLRPAVLELNSKLLYFCTDRIRVEEIDLINVTEQRVVREQTLTGICFRYF